MGSQDGQRPTSLQFRLDGMNAEEQRLQTFRGWPVSSVIDSARIAKAGFFHTGRGLEVECFACGGRISEWNYGDIAMTRHRELNANCPFVRNPISSSNIPIVTLPSPVRQEPKAHLGNETSPIYNQGGPDYRREEVRLASFSQRDGKRWPKAEIVSPSPLARAGFYWNPRNLHGIELSDRVTCAFCEVSLGGWESGDDPQSEHRRCSNTCPFVMGAPVGNVPIPRSPSGQQASVVEEGNTQSHPRCATDQRIGGNQFGNEKLVELVSSANGSSSSENRAEMLGVHRHRGPVYVRYSTVEARLASFSASGESSSFTLDDFRNRAPEDGSTGWPLSRVKQTPQALADAGFFCSGQNDQVRCFHCGGGLWDWRDDDDPWVEHAKWFPNCAYVMLVKGEAFIEAAKKLRPPTHPSSNTSSSPISAQISTSSTSVSSESHQPLGPSDFVGRSQPVRKTKVRNVTSEELDELMGSAPVLMALEVGLDPGRVRNMLQRKIEETGIPFSSPDALVMEVLDIQMEERGNLVSEDESDDSEDGQLHASRIYRNSRIRHPDNSRYLSDPEYYSGSDSENEREGNDPDDNETSEEDNLEVGELDDGRAIARLLRELSRAIDEPSETETKNERISESESSRREQVVSKQEESSRDPVEASENLNSRVGSVVESGSSLINSSENFSSQITEEVEGAKGIVVSSNEHKIGEGESKLVNKEICEGMTKSGGSDGKVESSLSSAAASSLAALEEENRRFRESRLCKVCIDEEVGVVFLPCGHLVSCVFCAPRLRDCPMCRRAVKATVRTYLS